MEALLRPLLRLNEAQLRRRARGSLAVHVFPVPHALNLDNLRGHKHLVNDAVISDTDAMCMVGPRQLVKAVWEWFFGWQLYSRSRFARPFGVATSEEPFWSTYATEC